MEDLSDDGEDTNVNPIMKPKTRSPAQIEAFKKAQQVRLDAAKAKKQKLDEMKKTIKLECALSPEEKETSGMTKLQQEREEIEKKILAQAKEIQDKKQSEADKRKAKKEELRAKEKEKEDIKELKKQIKQNEPTPELTPVVTKKKEPKIIYESESEEEVVIVKKKKKQPKVVYQNETDSEEEEAPAPKPKKSPVVSTQIPSGEKQPQIIKTNQIRFF